MRTNFDSGDPCQRCGAFFDPYFLNSADVCGICTSSTPPLAQPGYQPDQVEQLAKSNTKPELASLYVNVGQLVEEKSKRIKAALEYALKYGQIDGAHHKTWVIDQIVRALTGSVMVRKKSVDVQGNVHYFEEQDTSNEYARLIDEHRDGEDGPNTYIWDQGTPP